MKYFVTGATGFIGGRLAAQLCGAGHQVVTLARDPGRAGHLENLGVDVRFGDITDKESLHDPMRGVDGVFHLAGWYKLGARDKNPAYDVNVEGTRNVLTVMRDLAIPKGVYTSTLAVFSDTRGRLVDESYRYDGPHLTEYDRTKWIAHYEVADPMIREGLPLVIVQPGVTYGPGDTSVMRETFTLWLRGRLPAIPRYAAFCWAHVDDVAHAHILAMERGTPGKSYIIAGPPHTLSQVLSVASTIVGKSPPRLGMPAPLLRLTATMVGPLERVINLPGPFTADGIRSSAGVSYLGSNARARRELGYDPRSIEAGLPETMAHEMARVR